MTGPRPAAPRWTERDEKELFEMLNAGKTAVEISRKLRRTPGAIYSRLQRLYRRERPGSEGNA
jgi:DNA-binding NarL/FixJ family response regulator